MYSLLYSTRIGKSNLNLNFILTVGNENEEVVGIPSYFSRTPTKNILNILLITKTTPILIKCIKQKENRATKNAFTNDGELCYVNIKDNKYNVIKRHGEITFEEKIILANSLYNYIPSDYFESTNVTDNLKDLDRSNIWNIEYKFINEIKFKDSNMDITIWIIPYIINKSFEDCYKYKIIAKFTKKGISNDISILNGDDFMILEENTKEFIDRLSNNNPDAFNDCIYDIIPSAVDENGFCNPPIINMDKILNDKLKVDKNCIIDGK